MRPATVFAGLVGLLSIALLASGYLVPALLAAVFAALVDEESVDRRMAGLVAAMHLQ